MVKSITLQAGMNVSVPYSNGKNDKKTAAITKDEFLKSAKPKKVTIDGVYVGDLIPREFSSGGYGYNFTAKLVDNLELPS